MNYTEITHKKIMQKYNKIGLIKENKIEAKKKLLIAEAKKKKQEKEQELFEANEIENQNIANASRELDQNEKDFIDAYIEYNELTFLNKATAEITKNFIKALGENADIAIKELDAKVNQRNTRIKELSKKLMDIKDQILKETEKVKYKETLVSLFNVADPEISPTKNIQNKVKAKSASKDLVIPKNIIENKTRK